MLVASHAMASLLIYYVLRGAKWWGRELMIMPARKPLAANILWRKDQGVPSCSVHISKAPGQDHTSQKSELHRDNGCISSTAIERRSVASQPKTYNIYYSYRCLWSRSMLRRLQDYIASSLTLETVAAGGPTRIS